MLIVLTSHRKQVEEGVEFRLFEYPLLPFRIVYYSNKIKKKTVFT